MKYAGVDKLFPALGYIAIFVAALFVIGWLL